MANCYTESVTLIELPDEKVGAAKVIVEDVACELENDEDIGFVGYEVKFKKEGLIVSHDESAYMDHIETLVRALVEKLDLPPVVVSYSYRCDAPGPDEFGGGAFMIAKGLPTIGVDAVNEVLYQAEREHGIKL